jgi:type II secretory pathway predicted ATPase ExeA/LysM repeat protein
MYNSHFGFSESPFEINLDQRFLFLCEDHQEVLAALLYFVKEKKGLALVCGDVGTGKTMLLNSFLARLPGMVQPIIISNPLVSYLDLLNFIAQAVGIGEKKENVLELIQQVKEALLVARKGGKDYLLIVDEAHLFSDDNLEQIRLLSNIEVPEGKLLQILLVGQYELSHKLNRPEMRQLRQRVNISRFLSPLTREETVVYINHRLEKVGSNFVQCFEQGCEKLIYQLTGGFPRLINQLCDNALLRCMAEGLQKVNRRILKKAHEALLTDAIFTPKTGPGHHVKAWKIGKILIPLAACAALLVIGIIFGQTGFRNYFFSQKPVQATPVSKLPDKPLKEAKTPPQPQPAPKDQTPLNLSSLNAPQEVNNLPELPVPSPNSVVHQGSTLAENELKFAPPAGSGNPQVSPRPTDAKMQLPAGTMDFPSSPKEPGPEVSGKYPGQVIAKGQVVVKPTDTLNKIAATWYPENVNLGVEAILLANPGTINEDLISAGQTLKLPTIDPEGQTISLPEHLFYAAYGRYVSLPNLQKALSKLGGQGVRYVVLNTKNNRGEQTHRVMVGGYESKEDLNQALKRLGVKPGDETR